MRTGSPAPPQLLSRGITLQIRFSKRAAVHPPPSHPDSSSTTATDHAPWIPSILKSKAEAEASMHTRFALDPAAPWRAQATGMSAGLPAIRQARLSTLLVRPVVVSALSCSARAGMLIVLRLSICGSSPMLTSVQTRHRETTLTKHGTVARRFFRTSGPNVTSGRRRAL